MTPEQLDHLRRIDAHLASLLAIAEKRTPGEWESATETVWTRHERICGDAETDDAVFIASCAGNAETDDAVFIASCAGNAEAGWKATRAVIKSYYDSGICREWQGYMQSAIEPILAAFPNV